MDIRLFPDLIRQWIDIRQLMDAMHHDLPQEFRDDWYTLSWKRHQIFYGIFVPTVIHYSLFCLHDKPITQKHRKVIAAQALVTGLFDDLFDNLHLSTDRIRSLMETPDYIISSDHLEEHLCQYLFQEIHQHFTGNQHLFDSSIRAIMNAQELSVQQRERSKRLGPKSDIPLEVILHITKLKGAKAVLFYRSCFDLPVTKKENNFLSELGGLFQMTNDINDALKDNLAGETTIMNMGLTLQEIQETFNSQLLKTFDIWNSLSNKKYNKKEFFTRINIIVARSQVTLNRYGRLVDPTLPFDIHKIPKSKIISGLRIPVEIKQWYRHYNSLKDKIKQSLTEKDRV